MLTDTFNPLYVGWGIEAPVGFGDEWQDQFFLFIDPQSMDRCIGQLGGDPDSVDRLGIRRIRQRLRSYVSCQFIKTLVRELMLSKIDNENNIKTEC